MACADVVDDRQEPSASAYHVDHLAALWARIRCKAHEGIQHMQQQGFSLEAITGV